MHINLAQIACTGCTACVYSCPHDAIEMKVIDNSGYKYPVINMEKCTDCSICVNICPDTYNKKYAVDSKNIYAAVAEDIVRQNSSSGGFFPIVAEYILDKGGFVCGAELCSDMQVRHIIINNKNDLNRLKKSKYVESDLGNIFQIIKDKLNTIDSSIPLLFIGSPCQVAGLKSFLKKDYDNLITINFFCWGMPSQKIFDKYLAEEFPNEKILNYDFLYKGIGWKSDDRLQIITEKHKYVRRLSKDIFFQSFYPHNFASRPCCTSCKYSYLNIPADICMGNFWEVSKFYDIDDDKGTSLVVSYTDKGDALLNIIKDKFRIWKENVSKEAIKPHSFMPVQHKNYNLFIDNLDKYSLKENLNICLERNKNIGILGFIRSNNPGGLLTIFALTHFLNSEAGGGYNAKVINYQWDLRNSASDAVHPYDEFRNKYIPMTERRNFLRGIHFLNDRFNHFIIGSDQVFNPFFILRSCYFFLMHFVGLDKNLISYASSLGTKENSPLFLKKRDVLMYKHSFQRFNFLSVRENYSLETAKFLNGNRNVEQVLDPVFLLDKQVYIDIAKEASISKAKVVIYNTYVNDYIEKGIKFINEKLGIDERSIMKYEIKNFSMYGNTTIADWLFSMINMDLLITTSFHAVCFAIIFHKNFIYVSEDPHPKDRIESLGELLNLDFTGRIVRDFEDIDVAYIQKHPINYEGVDNRLAKLAQQSKTFLLNAINAYQFDDKKEIERKRKLTKYLYKYHRNLYWKDLFKYYYYKGRLLVNFSKNETLTARYKRMEHIILNYRGMLQYLKENI